MPRLRAAGKHRALDRDGHSDLAEIDRLAGRLEAGAEERIRRAADANAFGLRVLHELAGDLEVGREGFLVVDVLALRDGLEADGTVSLRNGEVQNEVDFRVSDQLFRGEHVGNSVLRRRRFRPRPIEIGDRDNLGRAIGTEVLKVNATNVAKADDADAERCHGPQVTRPPRAVTQATKGD